MNKKNLFLLLTMFLIIGNINVFGDSSNLTYKLIFYNNYNENLNNSVTSSYNGVGTGSYNYMINGKINKSINFSGGNSTITINSPNEYSVFAWIRINNTNLNSDAHIFGFNYLSGASCLSPTSGTGIAYDKITNKFQLRTDCANGAVSNGSIINGTWYYVGFTKDISNNWTLYINGINSGKYTKTVGTSTTFSIGNFLEYGSSPFYGEVDELGFWNRTLNQTEINLLYNNGNGLSYPFSLNFSITDKNNYNNASISNFSAFINGITYNTTDGTITTPLLSNSTSLWNITIISNNMFNKTYLNQNISTSLLATQDQYPILYAKNIWNQSNISSFNVTNGGFHSTTDTLLYLPLNASTNILIQSQNYFSLNTTLSLLQNTIQYINLSQSIINFSLFEFDSNISLSNFTLNITNYGIPAGCNTTGISCLLYPNVGIYNFSVLDNSGQDIWTLVNNSLVVNSLDNKTFYAYITEHFINVTSRNIINNASILNFSIHLTDLTDNTDVRDFNTTNGSILIPVIHHTYNLTIFSNLFSVYNNSEVIIINSSLSTNSIYNKTFYLYTINSINLTFRDALTQNIINSINLTIQFIGGTSQTNITSTGNLYVDLLTPSEYTILTNGEGYIQNSYILNLINQSYNPITIYIQQSSNTTYYVLFTVIDKLSRQPLQGATVTIQRWINNAWVTEQIYTTDFNGRGQGYFILNTQYYNFVITYNGITYSGQLNSDANKKIIYFQDYLDGLGIEINLAQTNYINTIQDLDSVTTSLKYINQTNSSGYFVYNWIDSDGNSRNATLNVYQNNILNCSSSAYSSSGSINCFVDANNSELFFTATTFIDGIPDKGLSQKLGISSEWNFDWGIGGWIFTIFLVIIAFTAFAQVPAISIMLGSIFFALALFFNILFTQNANISQLGIIIIFVAFLLSKIPSNSGVNG